MRERLNPVTLYCGSIYNAAGEIIEQPAVLVDVGSDCFHGWGENRAISKKLNTIAAKSNGMLQLTMIDLSKLPKEMACYVILRMMNYTASGFIKTFASQAENPNAIQWLQSEMNRVRITIPTTMQV